MVREAVKKIIIIEPYKTLYLKQPQLLTNVDIQTLWAWQNLTFKAVWLLRNTKVKTYLNLIFRTLHLLAIVKVKTCQNLTFKQWAT